jgi:hypothetical protein
MNEAYRETRKNRRLCGFQVWMAPLIAQVIDGALRVGRVPQNNNRDEQV